MLLSLPIKAGARYSEIMGLLRSNTNLEKQTATFKDTKNGTDRTIPLSDEVVAILKRYPFGDTFLELVLMTVLNFILNRPAEGQRSMILDSMT